MESHISHIRDESDVGVFHMRRCQICHEPIWERHVQPEKGKHVNEFICSFCFSRINRGKHRPSHTNTSDLFVCDKCGETVEGVEWTDEGWVCEYCQE
ncbi:MAG: hypothetical protein JXC85_03060 [Candidatus Aenigmarchaeota archaeon]|nr:hypothetical protein [Candidatus Aenigmarchaeota archaeon]